MNFDDALKRYWPAGWFRFKFLKYKYLKRGEPELWLIRHLVERGTTALDVGSSIGMYAQEMARYARKVIAFEANPAVAEFTRSVAARNVEVITTALSSSAGRATLKIPLNPRGHTIDELATIEPGNFLHAGDTATAEVAMQRLDDLPISNCSFIKVDVEGHEEAMLDGASALIAAQRPVLMLELNDMFNKGVVARVAARYAALSYRGFFLSHGKIRPIAAFDPVRDQDEALLKFSRRKLPAGAEFINNFVFIPQEKCERVLARLPSSLPTASRGEGT
jgi:FkbM family methyltransferase